MPPAVAAGPHYHRAGSIDFIALAGYPHADFTWPISQCTARESTDELKQCGIVDQSSGRHVAPITIGISNRT